MARGVNKVIAIGNLGQDPETRYVPSGAAVTTFSLAVDEQWKDKSTGEQMERTEWINVEVWGNAAEACAKYLSKGSQCYVEGSLKTDSWDDEKTGAKMYRTKVRANNVQFLGGKGEGNRNQRSGDSTDQDGMPPRGGDPKPEFDDDIPF